jgi:hypothetical protein
VIVNQSGFLHIFVLLMIQNHTELLQLVLNMQNIHLKATDITPEIIFNFTTGEFVIQGVSYPEYAKDFYEPILKELEQYADNPSTTKTVMSFKFTYFNTGTNTLITGIFKELEKLEKMPNHTIAIFWYYEEEDEDMLELGEYFKSLTHLPIVYVEAEEL